MIGRSNLFDRARNRGIWGVAVGSATRAGVSARYHLWRGRRHVALLVSTALLGAMLVLTVGPVTAAGASTLYTSVVAGSSVAGSGDGGPALVADGSVVWGGLGRGGGMFITDGTRVRMVPAPSGTFSTVRP